MSKRHYCECDTKHTAKGLTDRDIHVRIASFLPFNEIQSMSLNKKSSSDSSIAFNTRLRDIEVTLRANTPHHKFRFMKKLVIPNMAMWHLFIANIDIFSPRLTHLTIGRNIDEVLPYLPQLTSLCMGQGFNQPLTRAVLPNLTVLTMGYSFNSNFDLPGLTSLTMGYRFNQQLPDLPHLRELVMGVEFDQELIPLPNLESLNMDGRFNQNLPDELPNLKSLVMGESSHFNQQLYDIYLPQLELLKIDGHFSHKLPDLPNLTSLDMGFSDFNHELPDLPNLTSLDMGNGDFNHMLPDLPKLTSLYMNDRFNQRLSAFNLPHLTSMVMGYEFNKRLPELPNLMSVTVGWSFEYSLPGHFHKSDEVGVFHKVT